MGQQINSRNQVYTLMLTGLMAAIVLAATSVFKIPVAATNGYVHFGDAMIFLSVIILGRRNGTLAAATGSALADLLGGYVHWVPWTFAIKGLMAFAFGTLLLKLYDAHLQNSKRGSSSEAVDTASDYSAADYSTADYSTADYSTAAAATDNIGMIFAMSLSSLVMIAGYFIAQRIIYGNIAAPLAALPGNIVQAAAGITIAMFVFAALKRTKHI